MSIKIALTSFNAGIMLRAKNNQTWAYFASPADSSSGVSIYVNQEDKKLVEEKMDFCWAGDINVTNSVKCSCKTFLANFGLKFQDRNDGNVDIVRE